MAAITTLKPGDEITVVECDYMYGGGTLWLRITTVGARTQLIDGEDWLKLAGLQLRSDGTQLSDRPRHALVRLSAIRQGIH
jgi:hypothetical protein